MVIETKPDAQRSFFEQRNAVIEKRENFITHWMGAHGRSLSELTQEATEVVKKLMEEEKQTLGDAIGFVRGIPELDVPSESTLYYDVFSRKVRDLANQVKSDASNQGVILLPDSEISIISDWVAQELNKGFESKG